MAALTRRASDVRINEVDLSSSIISNSNATAAMAVVSGQGPLNPTYYSAYDNFEFDFGPANAAVSFDHYAARDYFREGNSLWAARAPGLGYKTSTAIVKLDAAGETVIFGLTGGVVDPTEPDWLAYVPDPLETPLYQITSKRGPGSYGNNIAVSIESQTLNPVTSVTVADDNTVGTLATGAYEYQVSALGKGGETLPVASVSHTIGAGKTSLKISWPAVPGAVGYYVYGRTATTSTFGRIATVGAAAVSFVDIGAIVPDHATLPLTVVPPSTGLFDLLVFDLAASATRPVESFTCSVTEQTDETGSQMEVTQRVNPFSRFIRVESNVFSLLVTPVIRSVMTPVAFKGGTSGAAPTVADINNAVNQFQNKEKYVIDVFPGNGRGSISIQQNLEELARTRNDAVAFLDVPSTKQTAQAAVDFRNLELNLNSSYAALFCSDLLENDPNSGKILFVPPSGAMAGLYARTSRIAQPWFSIAGLNRGLLNVLDIRNAYDDGEATYLFKAQVNYMRKFVGKGIPLWEQSTLYNKNSATQFLNVRFLLNVLKRAMYDYLLYGLQEPGDDILRKQLQFALEEYLKLVQATRGISSYRVVISDVNNPPSYVNSGVLAIAVIITPILAVREIQLTLVISKEGLTITEADIASL